MSTRVSRTFGVIVAAAALLGLSWASTAELALGQTDDAIVRISIAARPERIESCRIVSDEELAKVAPQMRQRIVCEGTTARYRLELWDDDLLLHAQVLRGGGLRHDRRMYVLRDVRVPPGRSRIRVHVTRVDTVARPGHRDESGDDAESARRRRQRESVIPAELRLDHEVDLRARGVLLVTYDPEQRRLLTRQDTTAGSRYRGFPDDRHAR